MRTGRPIPPLKITTVEREALEAWARGHDRRLAGRAAVILASADGVSNKGVASDSGTTPQTVGKWRARFRAKRLEGLHDEPRPGAPRRISDEDVARVIRLSRERAPNGSSWTTRSMAQSLGLTQTAISRIWRTHGVKPAPANGKVATAVASSWPGGAGVSAAGSMAAEGGVAQTRVLAAIDQLLADARALREICAPEMDPLLDLAIDAAERAMEKHREPGRSSAARAQTALRNARNLLDSAEAAARTVQHNLSDRQAAASAAAAAMRGVADGLRDHAAATPAPRRCPSCGAPYTLRFTVRGAAGEVVTARVRCPRSRCRKPISVLVPKAAQGVRVEEPVAS